MKITIDIPGEYIEKIVFKEMEQIITDTVDPWTGEDEQYYDKLKEAAQIIKAYYEIQ
jgi:hypothetical protein